MSTSENLLSTAQAMQDQLITWRRQIHRYPELSYTETRTAGLVAKTLSQLGIPVETEVAKTGVVGTLRGGDGPTIALRADMDALPIQEQNDTDFDSGRPGLMHACGHDAHTSILLGAATLLTQVAAKGALPGTVRFLFQPSEEDHDEEGKSGGQRMVEEGMLNDVAAVFGLHVDTNLDVGTVGLRSGSLMASADTFRIDLFGQAAHAARPQQGIDTIALAAQAVQAIHQIVSRRIDPIHEGVVTIGTIQGGTKNNIIADQVSMTGTIRSYDPDIRRQLHAELHRACSVVEALGGRFEIDLHIGYPPTVNNPQATAVMHKATTTLLGEAQVVEAPKIMAAEDFSYMAQAAPGCFLRLGVHDPAWADYYHVHTPTFRMDERALPIGAATLATTVLTWLDAQGQQA